jgi:hypothetical protein
MAMIADTLHRRRSLTVTTLTLTLAMALLPGRAIADVLCHVASAKAATLEVRDLPGGKVVAHLANELVVRIDESKEENGIPWSEVSGGERGEWRNWGWVVKEALRCVDTDKFPREKISAYALRAAGIAPQSASNMKPEPISCDVVPNGWGVTISKELYDNYRQRGFSEKSLCLALGTSGVYFNPDTGERLNLYEITGDIFGLRPLRLPDCYRTVRVIGTGGYLIGWQPTGCQMRYHPSTGLPIEHPGLVELDAGGEAGGGVDEDNRSSTVSESRLRELLLGR